MQPGYAAAKYDLFMISDSGIRSTVYKYQIVMIYYESISKQNESINSEGRYSVGHGESHDGRCGTRPPDAFCVRQRRLPGHSRKGTLQLPQTLINLISFIFQLGYITPIQPMLMAHEIPILLDSYFLHNNFIKRFCQEKNLCGRGRYPNLGFSRCFQFLTLLSITELILIK